MQDTESPEYRALQSSLAQYGMTVADYNWLLAQQSGRCKLCGKPPKKGKRLVVDHCHKTSAVRGLLCGKCNLALGLLGDDPEAIRRAYNYVTAPPTNTVKLRELYAVKRNGKVRKTERHVDNTIRQLYSVTVASNCESVTPDDDRGTKTLLQERMIARAAQRARSRAK